mgnify:FL=1
MRKYLPYIGAVLVLAAVACWFVYNGINTPESINKREGAFAVEDVSDIDRIYIENSEKKHVTLTKKDGKWYVDGDNEVRADMISNLLDVLKRVESLSPVPSNAHDNVLRSMAAEFVKVDVYTGSDKPEKSFLVGGATIDNRGTYMLLDMGEKMAARPHIAFVPGYQGYLTPVFNTDHETWRSRVVFSYKPEEIKQLKLEYATTPEKSFVINQVTADSFTVAPINPQYKINEHNEAKYITQYLGFYKDIQMEAYDNDYPNKDSIYQRPFAKFTLINTKGEENEVNMYYMPIGKRTKERYDQYGRALNYDPDRYYATTNHGKDFTIVQYVVFGKLLRQYKDFYYKPGGN